MRTCSLPRRPSALPSAGSSMMSSARAGALLDGRDEVAGDAVLDLQRDPADVAADERPALPQRLGHGQAEALARRLLDHDVGERLERVDLDRADVGEVVEDVDVRVAVGVRERRVVEVPALRVVGRHRADERELHVGPLAPSRAGRRRSRPSGPSTGRSARPGRASGGRCRSRTARRRTRRPRARAPCSSARAGRSPAGRCGRRRPSRPARSRRRGTATPGSPARTAAAAPSSPGSASRRRCGSARSSPRLLGHERRAAPPAAGRARCTRPSRRDSSRAFISLYCAQVAHCSSVRSCGLPCSALCISFVALKNSSRP